MINKQKFRSLMCTHEDVHAELNKFDKEVDNLIKKMSEHLWVAAGGYVKLAISPLTKVILVELYKEQGWNLRIDTVKNDIQYIEIKYE